MIKDYLIEGVLMPTYEYLHSVPRKRGCPKLFELVRKVLERDDPALCPKCGSLSERQLSMPALSFRGNGFYVTDSRNSSTKNNKSDDSPQKPHHTDAKND